MKGTLQQTITLLTVILGLALPIANSARGSVLRHESAPAILPDALQNDSPRLAIGFSLGFTMADFTGDTHPDLATLELNGFDSVSALYVIEVRFSEGGRQSLRMKAPFGGLLIAAKDVTGDGSLDLVIRAARSRALVAVFLNDGHGNFFTVEPEAFTKTLREDCSEQEFAPRRFSSSATLISPKSYANRQEGGSASTVHKQNGSLFSVSHGAPSHSFLSFGLNRAPPAVA
jgi:hypothetical protein